MSLKIKLVSTISAFFLVLGLLIMGVWSAPSATINLGGNLTFTATDVNATVTGDVSGANNTVELPDLQFTNTTNVEEASALWSNKELEFDNEGSEISILVTITNNATDRPLYASIEDKYPTITNITKGMTRLDAPDAQSGTVYQEDVIEIPANQTGNTNVVYIKLTMSVTDVNESLADDLVYGYDINLNNDKQADKLTYTFNTSNKTASVKMTSPSVTKGNIIIPETVVGEDGETYTVTAIDAYAFIDMQGAMVDPDLPNAETEEEMDAIIAKYVAPITSVTIPSTVETVSEGAFGFTTSLESVTFKKNPTTIGEEAFTKSGLKYLTIESGIIPANMFKNRDLSTSIILGNGVTSIGDSAFEACSGLTEITIPGSVETIGASAFSGCRGLTSVTIGNGVKIISNYAFDSCENLKNTVIPASVTSIGAYAFRECNVLAEITIPGSVETIGDYAFKGCRNLTSVTIGNGVKTIGGCAFYQCYSISGELVIPDSVTSIGASAFYVCSSISGELVIPDSVTSIGASAFLGCSGLTSVTIGNGVKIISKSAFNGCENLKNIVIPDSVTSIGDYAFQGCSGLTEIIIPGNVETIGDCAFSSCENLKNIVIPDSVTSIGKDAFRGCSGITEITISVSVETIGSSAFAGLTNLKTVNYTGTEAQWSAITIGDNNSWLLDAEKVFNYVPGEE